MILRYKVEIEKIFALMKLNYGIYRLQIIMV